jgi:Protein of unknown function (DUF3592)
MANAFLILFTLFWSGLVLSFDWVTVHSTFQQIESSDFKSVTGKVTQSEVRTHHSSKHGTSYSAHVAYRYTVDAQTYTSDKLRFLAASSSSADAASIVNAHPVGAAVTVYYNPAQPAESLLAPGVIGADLMIVLFLTPFNAVMFGFWIWIGGWLRERLFHPVAGGMKIITNGLETRVRLPRWSPWLWGLGIPGILAFVFTLILAFTTQMKPSVPVVTGSIVGVYGCGVVAFLRQWMKIRSGIDDLIISESAKTVQLPLTFGRTERMTISSGEIESVWVEQIVHTSSKGGISYTYAPTLRTPRQQPPFQKLADWSDKLKADDFAQWLAQKLGIPVQ